MNAPAVYPAPRAHRPLILTCLVLVLGMGIYGLTLEPAYRIHGKYVTETVSEFGQLPSPAVQAASLEFKGVVADFLFFKTMTFLGLKIGEKKNPSREEWQLIHEMLQRVTDLDPRFWDPYVFTEMMLVWQAGMFDEANALLEKAAANRPEDYWPNFYIGFNYMYFKKDMVRAAPYLRSAANSPKAPSYVKGLAARMSVYAGQTGTGIFFLENLIKETADPRMAKYLEKRLLAMKMLFYLEGKVKEFKDQYQRLPKALDELVTTGLVPEMPVEPYGGKFILLENGRVYTTSKMIGPY